MDGAMKFVKGDAIAGIVITLVNLLGGVTIGVLSRGLDIRAEPQAVWPADHRRRHRHADPGAALGHLRRPRGHARGGGRWRGLAGSEIGQQLFGDARVLFVGALLLGLIALVPGMPTLPFLLAAALCAGLAWRAQRQPLRGPARAVPFSAAPLEPLAIELGPSWHAAAWCARRRMSRSPPRSALPAGSFPSSWACRCPCPACAKTRARPARIPAALARAGPAVHTLDASAPLASSLAEAVRRLAVRSASDCLDLDQVQRLVDQLEREQPALVRLTVPRLITLPLLARVLRSLIDEGVSARMAARDSGGGGAAREKDADPANWPKAARRARGAAPVAAAGPGGIRWPFCGSRAARGDPARRDQRDSAAQLVGAAGRPGRR
jgi:hypothetical protein